VLTPGNWREHSGVLAEAEVLVSTWGGPVLTSEMLQMLPRLELYCYAAGDMSRLMTDGAWERGVRITTANAANAIPVAEFALSQIIFSLKRGWEYMVRAKGHAPELWGTNKRLPGLYGSRVGILSIGMISRKLCALLKNFELEVVASCPHTSVEEAQALGVELVGMETLFATCDVISIHLRGNNGNRNRIDRSLLDLMKKDSTLINTARGSVINQDALVDFLRERPDVYACIDVTEQEPPPPDCALLKLPNVVLTPHLAGSMDKESRRLGHFIAEEIGRYLRGEPLLGEVNRKMLAVMA
jgi:phosphoglycerate dehydrogenase-like enzyme